MLMNKAKRMVQCEFGKEQAAGKESKFLDQVDDQGKGIDKNKNKKQTFVPTRTLEKQIVSEFVSLLKIGEDKKGRMYRSKEAWDIITEDKITTKLIVEDDDEKATRSQNETMTVEERMFS